MEYIIINYENCNKTYKIELNTNNIDNWNEDKLKSMLIDPISIASIIVGPKTVLEFFAGPNFDLQSYKVINDSKDQTKSYIFYNCPKDNTKVSVSLSSLKIWTYDYYNSIYGTRYCDSNQMCDENELCMCQTGKTNELWCPISKKRCMNAKYFYDSSEIPINNEDTIKTQCLKDQLNTPNLNFEDLKTTFRPCMIDKLKTIENFSELTYNPYNLIIFFGIIAILIVLFIKKFYKN